LKNGHFVLASVQELRNAIQRFRRSGKFAYIYSDTLGDQPSLPEYWLASSFDEIWLQPLGDLAINGISAEVPFARNAFDKFGIEPEMLHVGKYKSYPESMMRTSASPENREMVEDMLKQLNLLFVADISQERRIKHNILQDLMKQSPLPADQALIEGLVDSIGYHDEFDSYLEQVSKGSQPISFEDYHMNGPRPVPGEKIALITVTGVLAAEGTPDVMGEGIASAEQIVSAIEEATDLKSIRSIIIRVDSPGGTPMAADMIRRSISLASIRKPIIISMSNSAASGGYWMSIAANKIVAQPSTLTGSIGVFGGKFNIAGLWRKLGVNWQSFPAENQNDLWSVNKPYSTQSRQKIEKTMQRTYDTFINHVAMGRKISPDQVKLLAQGRVWTGAQAFDKGLVDALGGLDVAITLARDLAKIETGKAINIEPFPKPKSPIDQLLELVQRGGSSHLISTVFKNWLDTNIKSLMHSYLISPRV
jgi:protease-4